MQMMSETQEVHAQLNAAARDVNALATNTEDQEQIDDDEDDQDDVWTNFKMREQQKREQVEQQRKLTELQEEELRKADEQRKLKEQQEEEMCKVLAKPSEKRILGRDLEKLLGNRLISDRGYLKPEDVSNPGRWFVPTCCVEILAAEQEAAGSSLEAADVLVYRYDMLLGVFSLRKVFSGRYKVSGLKKEMFPQEPSDLWWRVSTRGGTLTAACNSVQRFEPSHVPAGAVLCMFVDCFQPAYKYCSEMPSQACAAPGVGTVCDNKGDNDGNEDRHDDDIDSDDSYSEEPKDSLMEDDSCGKKDSKDNDSDEGIVEPKEQKQSIEVDDGDGNNKNDLEEYGYDIMEEEIHQYSPDNKEWVTEEDTDSEVVVGAAYNFGEEDGDDDDDSDSDDGMYQPLSIAKYMAVCKKRRRCITTREGAARAAKRQRQCIINLCATLALGYFAGWASAFAALLLLPE